MKTIAQQLNVKKFPFVIKDENGKEIYFEDSDGYWIKREYDEKGKEIYFENSYGYWFKRKYDERGKKSIYEDSDGTIEDFRSNQVVLTLNEIAEKFNISVEQLKIKK